MIRYLFCHRAWWKFFGKLFPRKIFISILDRFEYQNFFYRIEIRKQFFNAVLAYNYFIPVLFSFLSPYWILQNTKKLKLFALLIRMAFNFCVLIRAHSDRTCAHVTVCTYTVCTVCNTCCTSTLPTYNTSNYIIQAHLHSRLPVSFGVSNLKRRIKTTKFSALMSCVLYF